MNLNNSPVGREQCAKRLEVASLVAGKLAVVTVPCYLVASVFFGAVPMCSAMRVGWPSASLRGFGNWMLVRSLYNLDLCHMQHVMCQLACK
jgi:hypothetical protein